MRSRTGNRPSFRSANVIGRSPVATVFRDIDNAALTKSNTINSSSFLHDPDGSGLKSTQELPIDYTSFENHTFFNSARSKVDISFNNIINGYPYDEDRSSIELFLDQLTGFERYVYNNFPKNVGYINLYNNGYIVVKDAKSFNFPILNTVDCGTAVLDPSTSPFSLEMQIKIPDVANDNQIIAQRLSSTAGMTLAISSSASTTTCNIVFLVSSASDSYVVASGSIQKGNWVHLSAQLEDINGAKRSSLYVDEVLSYTSDDAQDFGSLTFSGEPLYIGSGSSHSILDYNFTPVTTISASIDDFRYYKDTRTIQQLKSYAQREVYPDDSLIAYFKFNEPQGSYAGNNVALDSSGNKLHSYIINYDTNFRVTGSTPLIYENINYSPNLFAGNVDVINLNTNLLEDALSYDNDNPNFILKLIPQHYMQIGAAAEGLSSYDQNLGNIYTAISVPGTGILRPPQMIVSFLLSYAKFYDEIKMMLDYFSHVNYVELDDPESAIDKFLPYVAKYYGFELPNFFTNATPDQFYYGQTLLNDYSIAEKSLKQVRHQIWRRILGNIGEIIKAKGTRSSIRSAILSTGIIPENFFNIREYGGPALVDLKDLRQQTQEASTLADMSGSNAQVSLGKTAAGIFNNIPSIISPYLSASRVEPGFPNIAGSFIDGKSNNKNDGLLTSGSFAIESTIKFKEGLARSNKQSLFRLETTGSSSPASISACLMNVTYQHNATTDVGDLHLLVRSSKDITAPTLDLVVSGVNLFNGEKWYISAGRVRGDLTSSLSSSYFLRCGYAEDQTSYTYFTTSSYFNESTNDMFQNIDSSYNASGSFIIVGSQSIDNSSTHFLNNTTDNSITHFDGKIGQIRFWSKGLSEDESIEHLRNYRSAGVENPLINYNFDITSSGSFERLRLDVSTDQASTGSDANGSITLFDFSQNRFHMSGSGFESNKLIIKNENFQINRISPNIDLLQTDEKVRVRSLLDPLSTDSYTQVAPLYTLGAETAINDDNRFSIEYSAVKALNEDMIGLIGDTQFLDNSMGHTALLFDNIYPDIEQLSNVYFSRLTGQMNLRVYVELFKWFDSSLTVLLSQIIPRKTNFLGVNYVIESHLLERNRHRYLFDKQYLGPERGKEDLDIYLTALSANIKRF